MSVHMNLKFKTSEILKILKTNRETHKKDYEDSVVEYRKAALIALKKKLEEAENAQNITKISLNISLTIPRSFVKDYDAVISMLSATTDEIIELDSTQYQQLILDEWDWKQQFASSVTAYNPKFGAGI